MPFRAVLLTSILAASCGLAACGGQGDNVTAPTPLNTGNSDASPSDPTGRGPLPPPQPPPPASAGCDATKAQFAVGLSASADLLERARIAAQAGSARFIRPNEPITMEFLGSRLNLNLAAADVVRSAHCG